MTKGTRLFGTPQGSITDPRGGCAPDRVEVAEQGGLQVRIRGASIAQQPFTDDLGEAVRRHRIAVRADSVTGSWLGSPYTVQLEERRAASPRTAP